MVNRRMFRPNFGDAKEQASSRPQHVRLHTRKTSTG
jgi:hypothetical protein